MPLITPTPERAARFRKINKFLSTARENDDMGQTAKAVELMLQDPEFAEFLKASPKMVLNTLDDLRKLAWNYLYSFLYKRDYVAAAMILWDDEVFTPEPECMRDTWDLLFNERMMGIIGGGALGKCLAPGTPVRMFDGSIKKAKELAVGDEVMGDDSGPRAVIMANPGFGPMYRITPERGEPWECNGDHILVLRCGWSKCSGSTGRPIKGRTKGGTVEVSVDDWLKWSDNRKKQFYLYHVGVEYDQREVPFDPYVYGAWIGDGGWDTPSLHTPNGPMAKEWCRYFTERGFRIKVCDEDRCPAWFVRGEGPGIPNRFTNFIRTSREGNGEKFILQDYLINDRPSRLKLLAGLIDSDGSAAEYGFDYCTKHPKLAEQVAHLARSLGFAATIGNGIKGIKSIGFEARYYRVYISGVTISEIPTLEKFVRCGKPHKDQTHTQFTIQAIGDGPYNGIVIDGNHRFLLGDYTVTHNTYGPSAWLLLDWLLDPEWTRIQVASNSEDHLKKNLYADIIRLHSEAALPLPGLIDSESISLDKKRGMGIFVITLPGGPNSKGKIKGAHTKPRPPHPLFGRRSRIRMLIDEAQEVPANIFHEIPNRFSTARKNDNEHIKFIVCANPKDIFSEFGKAMKPADGWDRLPMAQRRWVSEEDWAVLSLNAMDHENVKQKKIVYKGFVTWEGVQLWLKRCHMDDQHPDMYTYVYGRFPPAGRLTAIISQEHLIRSEGEWLFDSSTENFASFDPAFTGDLPAMACGRTGRAVAYRRMNGDRVELDSPRMCIQIDTVAIIPKVDDTQIMADEVMSRLRQLSVKPQHFAIDRSGVGKGVHDVVRRQWKMKVGFTDQLEEGVAPIYGVNYSESGTEVKVAEEDTEIPKDLYDGIKSELWYAGSRLIEYDVVRFGRGVDAKTFEELSSRKGSSKVGKGRKQCVEGKPEYKKRTGAGSPDRADATLLLIQVCRMATSNLIPKAKDTEVEAAPPENKWGQEMAVGEFGSINMSGFDGATVMAKED